MQKQLTRRHVIAGAAWAGIGGTLTAAKPAPAAPVAIARCRAYDRSMYAAMAGIFDRAGGVGSLAKGKTVAIKLNLTGNPGRFPVDPALPYRTNPDTVLAAVQLFARAGAKRVRLIETFFPAGQDMQLWGRYGLDIKAIENAGCKVEWENALNLGQGKRYERVKVPWGGYIFPSYDLNHSFVDCDTFVSMSKLKHHWIAGVTMALKNNFGITPCSLYGGDCGESGNENPRQERSAVCHDGRRTPPRGVAQELRPDSPRDAGFRVPRIVTDLVGCRPIDFAIVDGIDTIRGGEGSWNQGVSMLKPGVLLAGRNPVCTDAVSMAVMGYNPAGERGTDPFLRGDNTLKLAEAVGIGTADLSRIEVAGVQIKDARFDFGPGAIGKKL
jgi:uncharacterized protein (DUF362 family)